MYIKHLNQSIDLRSWGIRHTKSWRERERKREGEIERERKREREREREGGRREESERSEGNTKIGYLEN